jgi:hypothetical protein
LTGLFSSGSYDDLATRAALIQELQSLGRLLECDATCNTGAQPAAAHEQRQLLEIPPIPLADEAAATSDTGGSQLSVGIADSGNGRSRRVEYSRGALLSWPTHQVENQVDVSALPLERPVPIDHFVCPQVRQEPGIIVRSRRIYCRARMARDLNGKVTHATSCSKDEHALTGLNIPMFE